MVTTGKKNDDVAGLSFEEALKELEAIVRKLEAGQGELDGSIADYARGSALKDHCHRKLAEARMKVEKIVQTAGGALAAVPFDEEK